jgi:hypothetical protein
MSNLGLRHCPRADVAIFADTQCEPQWVYDHLSFMEAWSDIPVMRITVGNLGRNLKQRLQGRRRRASSIPGWTLGEKGRPSPLWRQCTQDYKVRPIQRAVRQILGYRPRQVVKHRVACLLGISCDEAARMRPSRVSWTVNLYPLVDARMDRSHCEALLRRHGLPMPLRSACVFCPFHSDAYWRELKQKHAREWRRAVDFDRAIRDMSMMGVRSPVYLHQSCQPLELVNVDGQDDARQSAFVNDCEGLCGV